MAPRIKSIAWRFAAALGLALASAPVLAQIIVVPLDPVDPGEVQPGEIIPIEPLPGDPLAPGAFFPGIGEGTVPRLDGTELEPAERRPGSVVGEDVMTVEEDVVATGTGAVLKGLDKLSGTVADLTLARGETAALGWLQITLGECRYPVENPAGDAYAWLVVREQVGEAPIFEGWMIASSPALNALDHARFDVWVMSCTTE